MSDERKRRVRILWAALAPSWPDETERATHLVNISSSLLETGEYRTYLGLMRTISVPEPTIWSNIERAAEHLDHDPAEVFRDLYEPGDVSTRPDGTGGDDGG